MLELVCASAIMTWLRFVIRRHLTIMHRHYCTLFDHRYLPRGLAMIRSLQRVAPSSAVWVLCLSENAKEILSGLSVPDVHLLSLGNIEASDPQLLAARQDGRSLVEYYFTCKASLIAHVLHAAPDAEIVSYVDSDLWFFSSPSEIFEEAAGASVILTPHRFLSESQALKGYGKFNAGWLSFRRSESGLACLQWWRNRCLEWCRDHVDETHQRYADQRYLDRFSALFTGVHAIGHKGVNLAPWNAGACRLTSQGNTVLVDDKDRLVFFHFHGIIPLSENTYSTAHGELVPGLSPALRNLVYKPYLRDLRKIEHEVAPFLARPNAQALRYASKTTGSKLSLSLRNGKRLLMGLWRNSLVRVSD
jgi:hypothetical protein